MIQGNGLSLVYIVVGILAVLILIAWVYFTFFAGASKSSNQSSEFSSPLPKSLAPGPAQDIPTLDPQVEWLAPEPSTITQVDAQGKSSDLPAVIIYSKPLEKIPHQLVGYFKLELESRGWVYDPNLTSEGGYLSGNGTDGWVKNGKYFYVGTKYGKSVFVQYSK